MSVIYATKPNRMGMVSGDKTIKLSKDFLRDSLRAKISDTEMEIGKLSNVLCPFCEKGVLKLVSIDPDYQMVFPQMYHTGNHYVYECSEECGGLFTGDYSNTWIRE